MPFGALSDSTRAALAAGIESTGVQKQIENEGDEKVYALLPEVQRRTHVCQRITHTQKTATPTRMLSV